MNCVREGKRISAKKETKKEGNWIRLCHVREERDGTQYTIHNLPHTQIYSFYYEGPERY